MIELAQLEQLAAFAEYGTLSKAAEKLHMSQPTLTRAMQKLESAFGVPLFLRTKNRLELNENGKLAADIGFWHDLVTREMPHTRFLVQNERFALDELVQASVLPSFVSDLILNQSPAPKGRVVVPILDEGATAEYYAVCRKEDRERLRYLF